MRDVSVDFNLRAESSSDEVRSAVKPRLKSSVPISAIGD
jgi:hypothetical protein